MRIRFLVQGNNGINYTVFPKCQAYTKVLYQNDLNGASILDTHDGQ